MRSGCSRPSTSVNRSDRGQAPKLLEIIEYRFGSINANNTIEATDCKLKLPYGTVRPSSAKGTGFHSGDGVIHLIPLEVGGHLMVSKDIIYRDHQSFLLLVSPTEGVYNLGTKQKVTPNGAENHDAKETLG
ncbi:unnamed protein product [Lactuca saligna]|uniref:Uncharacterized protein n=1 Tax=Lactuca saligna TaxID=75948 RepID=A0AA35VNH0_LACSI|nr:unnamed protein product [Lactuca saligna]